METVYLLYEGDEWLSKDSLVLMGIFTSTELLRTNAEKLIRQRAKLHINAVESQGFNLKDYFEGCCSEKKKADIVVEDILTELLSRGATSGWDVNYCTTEATLNELGEI